VSVCQPEENNDADPDLDFFAFIDPIRAYSNDKGTVLFLELNRPREYEYLDRDDSLGLPPWRDRPVSRAHELAREVGRMFGGLEDDTESEPGNESLMAKEDKRMRGVFGDVTLSKIRQTVVP
jgi:hypothetical protein